MRLAHKLAIASDYVRADMVEAMEFPHLSMRYGVRGVPRTIVNDKFAVEGAMPEAALVPPLVKAVLEEE